MSGRVPDVAFRGYEHAIDINASTRLTGVFARAKAPRGETAGLRLDPAGGHVFPAEAEKHQTHGAERASFPRLGLPPADRR